VLFVGGQAARAAGSIFEVLLSETLEAMLPLHSLTVDSALRRHGHWHEAYGTATRDGTFAVRRQKYSLMVPRKRRILMKLLAARALTEAARRRESRRRARMGPRPPSPTAAVEYPYDPRYDPYYDEEDGGGGYLSWGAEAVAAPGHDADDPLTLDRLAAMVDSLVADSTRALAAVHAPGMPQGEAEAVDLHGQLDELLLAWTDLLDAHGQGDLPDQVRGVYTRWLVCVWHMRARRNVSLPSPPLPSLP